MAEDYTPKLNPTRGMISEKFQPVTNQLLDRIEDILEKHDEVIISVGSSEVSNRKGQIMKGGERIAILDNVLQARGIDPGRYMLIPNRDYGDEDWRWVSDLVNMLPKWDTFYSSNFRNVSTMLSHQDWHGRDVVPISEQRDQTDFYEEIAHIVKHDGSFRSISQKIPTAALDYMSYTGVFNSIDTVYNFAPVKGANGSDDNRILFLGGFQPFTGVFEHKNGHLGVAQQALATGKQLLIPVGSGQDSHKTTDPLEIGKRVDVIDYTLKANGINPKDYLIIPIKDTAENAGFPVKVTQYCPRFNAIIAGNDWTKELFGFGNYEVIALDRTPDVNGVSISGTGVRNTEYEIIKDNHVKGDPISLETIGKIEYALKDMVDKHTLDKLNAVGYHERMQFLSSAVD